MMEAPTAAPVSAAALSPDHNEQPISTARAPKKLCGARKNTAAAAAARTKAQTNIGAAEDDSNFAIQSLRAAGIGAETLKDLACINLQ